MNDNNKVIASVSEAIGSKARDCFVAFGSSQ
jgi:hypothetical protein